MTREEALEIMEARKYICGGCERDCSCKECCTAYDMAIEALQEQSEIIRCKDCRHNHNCEIQYHAQADDLFYCGWGAEERKEAQAEIKEHTDPERLIQMIRYSSQYNAPCPEWVYDVIRNS